ncbi:hypothetical protein F5884DRAFT_769089 [Xylogone sp. PMI_703]|nr:hypothetical protein F5884DRAFT_769089 [Xylogone sp. PMI_703]
MLKTSGIIHIRKSLRKDLRTSLRRTILRATTINHSFLTQCMLLSPIVHTGILRTILSPEIRIQQLKNLLRKKRISLSRMHGVLWKKFTGTEETNKHKYEAVSEIDSEFSDATEQAVKKSIQQHSFQTRFILTTVVLLLVLIGMITTIVVWIDDKGRIMKWDHVRLDYNAPKRRPLTCGNSTEEAEALGCVYDALAANWLHKDCPRDYADEFYYYNNGTPWPYWKDQRGTQQMTLYELAHNGYYWSSTREHLVHCSFILKRGHDVMSRGDRMDGLVGKLEHANHCAQFLMENLGVPEKDLDRIRTYGTIGFLTC